MVALTLPLDAYIDMQNINQWFNSASSPFVSAAVSDGEVAPLTAEAAFKLISDAKYGMDALAEVYREAAVQLPAVSIDEMNEESVRYFATGYANAALVMSSQLIMLKTMFVYAESNPIWKPHLIMLRGYTRPAVRTLANLRNLFEDTAKMLSIHVTDIKHTDNPVTASQESLKSLVDASHKKFGLSPAKWS